MTRSSGVKPNTLVSEISKRNTK